MNEIEKKTEKIVKEKGIYKFFEVNLRKAH